jgi:hypothetical protein
VAACALIPRGYGFIIIVVPGPFGQAREASRDFLRHDPAYAVPARFHAERATDGQACNAHMLNRFASPQAGTIFANAPHPQLQFPSWEQM